VWAYGRTGGALGRATDRTYGTYRTNTRKHPCSFLEQGARLSEKRKADERSYKSYRSHRSYPSFRPTCPYVSRGRHTQPLAPLPKQRGLRLGDNALVSQKVVGDDVMDLFDFIEQTVGESHEFVGLEHPAGALVRFKEE
jgi:hypothetical protein